MYVQTPQWSEMCCTELTTVNWKLGGSGDRHLTGMDYLSWTCNLNYVIQRLHEI